jgi:hypothetical protein
MKKYTTYSGRVVRRRQPYTECGVCKHNESKTACPCEVVEEIKCTAAHVKAVRRLTN